MNKPINPNVQIPPNFAVNGQKADFTQQKIQNGFNMLEPDILAGDNLNKFIDDTYKSITYSNAGVADLYRSAIVYDAAETYYQNSIVFNVDLNGEVSIYLSKVNDNVGNSLSNNNYWEKIQLGTVRNIGEIISSTLPLTDAGLHLLDGTRLSGDGIYKEFVEYIAELYTNNPTANYFCTETEWQQSVTTYGVCGKFVYDSVNNTVRLPKITGIIEGTIDTAALGDLVQAGLPLMYTSTTGNHAHTRGTQNITGSMAITSGSYSDLFDETVDMYGAFSGTKTALYADSHTGIAIQGYSVVNFNAASAWTGSTSLAGDHYHTTSWGANVNTIQPQTIKAFVYIVIATSVKTDIQVDIDEIATDLNGKAGTDLANVNSSGTTLAAGWSMPADNSTPLAIAANGTYTVQNNGYFYVTATATGAGGLYLKNQTNGLGIFSAGLANGYICEAYMPVAAGQTISANMVSGYINSVYFIATKG